MKPLSIALFVLLAAAAAAQDGYVLGDGKSLTTVGDEIDFAIVAKLPQKYGDHFLWMRRGGKTWIVRDAKALERAREVMKPQRELTVKRADISHRQIAISQDVGKYSMEAALLGAELAKLNPARDETKVAELQAKLGVVSGKLQDVRTKQAALDDELRAVVEAQEKLQPELMKALGAFADDVIAKDVAKAE